jgi:hypothetical protein
VESTPNGGANRPEVTYYDRNNDSRLSDQERDEDADGLSNVDETRGCGTPELWSALYSQETAYYLTYAGTSLDNPDTDGDGVRDGADDSDHDDLPTLMECSRSLSTGLAQDSMALTSPPPGRESSHPNGFVNPFNPCLPSPTSRSCNQYPSIGQGWAPFAGDDKYYFVWN